MRLSVAVALLSVINGALLVPSTAQEEEKRSLRGNTPPVNELKTTSKKRPMIVVNSPSFHVSEEKARAREKEDKDNEKNKQAQKDEEQKQKQRELQEKATNEKVEKPAAEENEKNEKVEQPAAEEKKEDPESAQPRVAAAPETEESAPEKKQQDNGVALPGEVTEKSGCSCGKGYFPALSGDTLAKCEPIRVVLTSPGHGDFFPVEAGATVIVSGRAIMEDRRNYALTINGEPATIEPDGSFSASVDLDALSGSVHRVLTTEIKSEVNGFRARDRKVVIAGESVEAAAAGILTEGVGVRITESAFDRLEPLVERTLAQNADLSNLIPRGTKLLSGHCFQDSFFGCLARGDVTVASFSHSGFDINLDPKAEDVFEVKVSVYKIKVDVDAETNLVDCGLKVAADTAVVLADFSFQPEQTDTANIDVQMRGDPRVSFSGFSDKVTGGVICDVLEELGVVSGIQSQAKKGLRDFVKKAAIDAEIEGMLDEVKIIDPFFDAMGIDAEAPIARISEDQLGITLSHDIALSPNPDANFPLVAGTLLVPQAFPVKELRSPNVQPGIPPYDFALVLSHSVLNWVLAALVESGLFSYAITEIDILGTGNPIELTAPLLSMIFPEFASLDPSLSLEVRLSPTLPPVTTGAEGPNGELVELNIAQFLLEIVSGESSSAETMWARIAIDAVVAADLAVDGASGEVSLQISPPDPELVRVVLLDNPLGIDEGRLQSTLVPLLARLIPGMLDSFPSFRIPEFLGLAPTVRKISRIGSYVGIFITL